MTDEWRDIATAPKDGTVIDLWCTHPSHAEQRLADVGWRDEKWVDLWGDALNPGWVATHWMPLPNAPTVPTTIFSRRGLTLLRGKGTGG